MAKLYFRYGTVNSAKTLNLLAVAHNYRQQGKRVILVKPATDTRFGVEWIATRAGLREHADILVPDGAKISFEFPEDTACVLVDEAQFLHPDCVDQFSNLAHACTYQPYSRRGIPVLCYGLRADFRRQAFPASRRLMELADSIEEIKTICHYCESKAIFNLKLVDGLASLDGPSIELGFEDKYVATCAACYQEQHWKANRARLQAAKTVIV
jgi:thymidine kinase